jgi:hypothetical protein
MNVHSLSNLTSQLPYVSVTSGELPRAVIAERSASVAGDRTGSYRSGDDRPDHTPKHVAALYFTISYPMLLPQRDARQLAWVVLSSRSRRKDLESVAR